MYLISGIENTNLVSNQIYFPNLWYVGVRIRDCDIIEVLSVTSFFKENWINHGID